MIIYNTYRNIIIKLNLIYVSLIEITNLIPYLLCYYMGITPKTLRITAGVEWYSMALCKSIPDRSRPGAGNSFTKPGRLENLSKYTFGVYPTGIDIYPWAKTAYMDYLELKVPRKTTGMTISTVYRTYQGSGNAD